MNLFKGAIFVTGALIANFYNGFSGVALFKDFYYSLYPVSLTVVTASIFLVIDKPFTFNPNKLSEKDADPLTSKNPNYNPAAG